ncbi:hypothetical protein X975_16435, partial [Stegodyphus mimosarum]
MCREFTGRSCHSTKPSLLPFTVYSLTGCTNLVARWPGVINHRGGVLHRDNARPHAAIIIQLWELLTHTPCSDTAPTDYDLFRALNSSFSEKVFDDLDAVKTAIQDFDSKLPWDPTRKMARCRG